MRKLALLVLMAVVATGCALGGPPRADEPEVSTCYDVEVGVSGTGEPVRRTCPVGAAPVHLPPAS